MAKTIGEVYGPAMDITELDAANVFFENRVVEAMQCGISREAAEEQERANLRFYAGHCSNRVLRRVTCLFINKQPYMQQQIRPSETDAARAYLKHQTERTSRIWFTWEPIYAQIDHLLSQYDPQVASQALEVLANLAIADQKQGE